MNPLLITNRNLKIVLFLFLLLVARPPHSNAAVVTAPTEAALRTALGGGGFVSFDCDGSIALSNTIHITADTELDGTGHVITIDGKHSVRLFAVPAGVTFVVKNLALANGLAMGSNNLAAGLVFDGFGGAIASTGSVVIVNCVVSNNAAIGHDATTTKISATAGFGGAIFSVGTLSVTNTIFVANTASGGRALDGYLGSQSASAAGGAIWANGTVAISESLFLRNRAEGARGGNAANCWAGSASPGSSADGGALANWGTLVLFNTSFSSNSASGGNGGVGQTDTCTVMGPAQPGGTGGTGGFARGGALISFANTSTIWNCTFDANQSIGGSGGQGGAGANPFELRGPSTGGSGGLGGEALGGALHCVNGTVLAMNSTVHGNFARGGTGGLGGKGGDATRTSAGRNGGPGGNGGEGVGGGLSASGGTIAATNVTCSKNGVVPGSAGQGGPPGIGCLSEWIPPAPEPVLVCGAAGTNGLAGAVRGHNLASVGGTIVLKSTIVAGVPSTMNAFGSITDAGHNLSSDETCQFTSAGSANSVDLKLGPLADYGGPTRTVSLLAGSPAIDGGDVAYCLSVDQRGRSRPFGPACDVGAFESSPPYAIAGRVTGCSAPGNVLLTAGAVSVSPNGGGDYVMNGLLPGTYSVFPSQDGCLLVPTNRWVAVSSDSAGVDFRVPQWGRFEIAELAHGTARILHDSLAGGTFRVLVSTNLKNWSSIATNSIGPSNGFDVLDPGATSPTRFYRLVSE